MLISVGESLQPGIELVLGHIVRIVVSILWLLARHAFDERFVFVKSGPWSIVDVEVMKSLATCRHFVGLKFLFERFVAAPHLTQKQRIEQFRGSDDLVKGLSILRCEFGCVGGQSGRREARDFAGQIRIAGGLLLSDQRGCN